MKERWKNTYKNAYNTCGSQVVTHPSTEQAQHCVTSVIRWELVYLVWCDHRQKLCWNYSHLTTVFLPVLAL